MSEKNRHSTAKPRSPARRRVKIPSGQVLEVLTETGVVTLRVLQILDGAGQHTLLIDMADKESSYDWSPASKAAIEVTKCPS